jgi:hypothetical protein
LRRQARELIDEIAPLDLPGAIAFLEFLRGGGGVALARSGASEDSSDTAMLAVPAGPKIVR